MANEDTTPSGILVADASPVMAGLIADMARGLGRRDIREVVDARAARRELTLRPFAFLILDDGLKGMDGVAFTKRLRADTTCINRDIPIILMAVAPDATRIAKARDAGVTEFLRKPFAANHLQTRLLSIEANPRGFVEVRSYTGPDRRRKIIDVGENDRRDASPADGTADGQ